MVKTDLTNASLAATNALSPILNEQFSYGTTNFSETVFLLGSTLLHINRFQQGIETTKQ